MKSLLSTLALALIVYASPAAADEKAAAIPAGTYTLDKSHASLIFRVDHLGFSKYTSKFGTFDATLEFDPAKPEASKLTATVDPNSITLDNPPEGFTETLRGKTWLNTSEFPKIIFTSTKVEVTGKNTGDIHGNLTLHGVTKPIILHATYNGGYAGHPMDPRARIGFSAKGSFKRSDFGISYGIPAPGTTMGVSDEVEVILETEFSGPPLKK